MIFKKLSIRNFQGCAELDIDFNVGATSIIGRNGSGKTTILDAISWVLFGKDVEGKSQFDIQKYDANGNTSLQNIFVSLVIEQNGIERVLSRKLTGSTTYCSVNDVPYKVSDYASYVGQLTDGEERFKLYSNPLYFFGLQWRAQRELLMNFFPVPSDELVLSKAEVGGEFKAKLKALTAEQVSLASKAKVKELERKRDQLIGQVKLLDEYCEHDVGDIKTFEVERGSVVDAIKVVDYKLKILGEHNETIYNAQTRDRAIRSGLEAIAYSAKERATRMHNSLVSKSADLIEDKAKLRKEFLSLIRIEGVCPICNQPFTEEMKAKSEKVYEQRESDIKARAGIIDEKLAEYQKNIEAIGEYVYTEEDVALIAEYRVELETIRDDDLGEPIDRGDMIKERDAIKGREDELNRLLARKDMLEENIAKRAIVKAELLKATIEKEAHEQLVKDSDRFIATRTDIVVEQINSKFKTIKVKLFDTLKNGDCVEAFEIVQLGIPYSALNKGQRLRVALELVHFLKEQLGVEAPIMFDDGESYDTDIINGICGQVIVTIRKDDSPLMIYIGGNMFKKGDKVRYANKRQHRDYPMWYPNRRTVGVIVEVQESGCRVQWKRGSTSDDDLHFAVNANLELVEE